MKIANYFKFISITKFPCSAETSFTSVTVIIVQIRRCQIFRKVHFVMILGLVIVTVLNFNLNFSIFSIVPRGFYFQFVFITFKITAQVL